MKAVVYERYGPPEVLQIKEVERPEPKADEIRVKVHATTTHIGDIRMRKPDPFLARLINGLVRPKKISILGLELAGEVEALGVDARRFQIGEQVFAFAGFGYGAYAEYVCLPEKGGGTKKGMVGIKPANSSYEEAAPLAGGGLTALIVIRKAGIQRGQKVLIYGASGSVGTFAVQLARHFGAEVTGVSSTRNLDLVQSLGAHHALDHTREEFALPDATYDVIFDAVDKLPPSVGKRALKGEGLYLSVGRDSEAGNELDERYFDTLRELVEAGELRTVIDRCYALEEIVEAHRYVERGHKVGNVAITVSTSI
jgi:NADPH:quinone reductase-like Zn-dependent oxidoreductase